MGDALPVSLPPREGESIESWLEHLADANGLSTATLVALIRNHHGRGGTRFLTLAPAPATMARIAFLARVPASTVRAASLAQFDGTAVNLTGLDPGDPHSYRQVAARGWTPAHGTQICPACLVPEGIWRTAWRLPIVTVCADHESYLVAQCPSCEQPFRNQSHSHLRRVGAATICGNPLGAGPTEQCQQALTSIRTTPARSACVMTQHRVSAGLSGRPVDVLGESVAAATYLSDLRHFTVLLLHLALQPHATGVAPWAHELQALAALRTSVRGPRWGLRPPDDPAVRSPAMTTADDILNAADLATGAKRLTPWLELAPQTNDGVLGWLADRTVMTPTLTRLITATRAPHRRLSHYLDHSLNPHAAVLDPQYIPQVIPADLFAEHLVGAFASKEDTVRRFASLCMTRMNAEITSWVEAAEVLGIPAATGVRTARACSATMLISHDEWATRLHRLMTGLSQSTTGGVGGSSVPRRLCMNENGR